MPDAGREIICCQCSGEGGGRNTYLYCRPDRSVCADWNFKLRNAVLVVTNSVRVESWPIVIVNKCYAESAGLVSTVDVIVPNGMLYRDTRQLYLLKRPTRKGSTKLSREAVLSDEYARSP